MTPLLFVAVGGAAGALVHYRLTHATTDGRRVVLSIAAACAALGFIAAALPRVLTAELPKYLATASPEWAVGLVCFGFLGAVAPMTSVASIAVRQLRARRFRDAAVFLVSAVVGGIGCAMIGILLYTSGVTLYGKL